MNTVPLLGDGRGVGGGTAGAGRLVVAVAVTIGHTIAPRNNISRQKNTFFLAPSKLLSCKIMMIFQNMQCTDWKLEPLAIRIYWKLLESWSGRR